MSLASTRLGANAPTLPAVLPPLSAALTRRRALFGAVTVAGVAVAAGAPALTSSPDAALIARAAAFRALREREHRAWGDLGEDDANDGPEVDACRALSEELREAGDALAEMPAATAAGLGAKATAMLTLVGSHLDTQANLSEQSDLVVSIMRDAARLGSGEVGLLPAPVTQRPSTSAPRTSNDRRLAIAADALDVLQTCAERHAAGARLDPDDPYTLAVADIDRVAAEMAALPADTVGGLLTKLRAMAVPIVREDEDSPLPLSVCRDLRRLHAMGAIS